MKRILIVILFAALVPLSSGKAQENGQAGPPPPGQQEGPVILFHGRNGGGVGQRRGMQNSQIRKQLEQIKIWQMTKEMNLPTEKAEKFFPLYNRYNEQMRTITAERTQAVTSLDSAVDNHLKDSELDTQIEHVLKLDDQLAATHVTFIKSLGGILSPIEVARYMVFEQRFDREIRQRIRMMMMQRGMRERGR